MYLPNKLDRISSIIKERERDGENTHTHRCTKEFLITHPPSLTHLQITVLTHTSEVCACTCRLSAPGELPMCV